MPETTVLLHDGAVAFGETRCETRDPGWSGEEPVSTLALVLLRLGSFERRADAKRHLADPLTAYVQRPGSIQRIAHRSDGDVSTVIAPQRAALGELTERALELDALPVTPVADLGHRMLIARARAGAESFELVERAITLAGTLIGAAVEERDATHRQRAAAEHRASVLIDDVRDSITADVGLRLDELAQRLGVPAYELSRTFRSRTGETVSRYRLRLRLHRALARMADGDRDLAGVAADSGFADQAHLTRALRQETGWTPGRLRTELAPSPVAG